MSLADEFRTVHHWSMNKVDQIEAELEFTSEFEADIKQSESEILKGLSPRKRQP